MTFTILGRDPSTGELGIGIATYSLAVGATCPQILPGIGVVTSQASTNPAIGEEIVELIEDGIDPTEAFIRSIANDSHPDYRQVVLLTPKGDPMVHSGTRIKSVSGHVSGVDYIAVGNFLANDNVLDAMATAFYEPPHFDSPEPTLKARLLAALEAGKEAGGQAGSDNAHLPERSAALLVGAAGERFPLDIRIDFSTDAISDLRRALDAYQPMHEYYLNRAHDPTELPSQGEWVKQLNQM